MTSKAQRKTWLGRIVALMAALGSACVSSAAVIAYDDLEDAALGTVSGQTSGTGFTGSYALGSGGVGLVTNVSLSYSSGDLVSDGGANSICVPHQSASSVSFMRAIGTQTSDDLYLSFLFNTPTADGASEDFLSFGFNNSLNQTSAGVAHRLNVAGTDHAFGIRTNASSEVRGVIGTEPNRTYFLVFRLRKLTQGAAQNYTEMTLYVDPSSKYEPPSPTMVVTSACWSAATAIAARVASTEAGDMCFLDNLCVGTTYNSVVYPAGNSPVTEQPVITPSGGVCLGMVTVSMSSPTEGATIRYTTDGSTPSRSNGTEYSDPFPVSASCRLQAIAYLDGLDDSAVSVANYSVQYHWVGGAADKNWSTVGNWDPAVSPVGTEVMFDNTGTNKVTATNNIVDVNTTISSLSYTNAGAGYHVTYIGTGVMLTVNGSTTPANVFFTGRLNEENGKTYSNVKMIGGGSLVVDAAQSDFLITKLSGNDTGYATLDLSGLGAFNATVSTLYVGRGKRTIGTLTLPSTDDGTTTITANKLVIGDSDGNDNGAAASVLNLGKLNQLYAGTIGIAATAWGARNVNSGTAAFSSGLTNALIVIRGLEKGDSRANLTVGSHGPNTTPRSVTALLDLRGGSVDAKLDNLIVGEARGYYWSNNYGAMSGTLSLNEGMIDVNSVILGRSLWNNNSSSANPVSGTLSVSNGFFSAGGVSMADNNSGTGQNVAGILNVSGTGTVSVAGNVTLGTGSGTATGVVATVNLSGGALAVGGNVAPGNGSTNVVSKVFLNGGALSATNTAGDATVRIERGTFAIKAGSATVNRLVVTNALTVTQVELRGTGMADYGRVTVVGGDVLLGGNLSVSVTNYVPKGGDLWTVVSGTGQRTGTFASVSLPDGMKVSYTESGFNVAYPTSGTLVMVR